MVSDTRKRVLIVQRDAAYGKLLEAWFSAAGYDVVQCVGPQPAEYRCPMLPDGDGRTEPSCALVEAADALIYDPWLYVSPLSPDAQPLLRALRIRYPDQPLILAWAMEGMPDLSTELTPHENVYLGTNVPGEIVGLVRGVLGPLRGQVAA